jgi:1-acyl-sn-glycerol-3-phosphate acyltransferase
MARVPLVVRGLEHLPAGGCVLVANHASYLDGLLMLACLPEPVSFVAKAGLKGQWFANWFLRSIDAQFVERFDPERGTKDADRLVGLAGSGRSLMVFPEGTFTRSPGLLAFHMGAFVTAAANRLPVVPLTIRGSRSVLRGDDWFLRRGTIAVIVGEPIFTDGDDWNAALELRNRARTEILKHVGEQDLALERGLT